MPTTYRVIDLRSNMPSDPHIVKNGRSPEDAVKRALGIDAQRRAKNAGELVARVYWDQPDMPTTMVRLYLRRQ